MNVVLLVDTYHPDYGILKKEMTLNVDEKTAKRWVQNGIARMGDELKTGDEPKK